MAQSKAKYVKQEDIENLPVFKTRVHHEGRLCFFYCPWCRVKHWHKRETGKVEAVCKTGPFKQTGYYLIEPGVRIPKRLN